MMNRWISVQRNRQGLILFGLLALLVGAFQNCQPFQGSQYASTSPQAGGSGSNSSGTTDTTQPPTDIILENKNAPVILDWPGDQVLYVGLEGNLSGTVRINNVPVKAHPGEGEDHQPINLNCSSSDNRVDVDCSGFTDGTANIDIAPDNGQECFSGEATITFTVTDREPSNPEAPELESGEKSFRVQMIDTCLAEQKVYADFLSSQDNLGEFVALDGNYAAIAAVGDDENSSNAGAIHVYRYVNGSWQHMQKLLMSNGAMSDKAGPVAIDGGKIIVGSPLHNSLAGAAYIFELQNGTWVETATLSPGGDLSPTGKDMYGAAVSINGSWAAVGAYQYTSGTTYGAGKVYLYQNVAGTWQLKQTLLSPSPAQFEQFGFSLDLEAGRVAVGAPADDSKNLGVGAVYTFTLSNGTWAAESVASTGGQEGADESSRFGFSVDLDGSALLVGAPKANGRRSNSGAAYLFSLNGDWALTQKIVNSDGNGGDEFGGDVALDGADIVISSRLKSSNDLSKMGAAYHYKHDGNEFKQTFKMMARDRDERDYFGSSVALDNGLSLVGSRLDDGKPDDFKDGVGSAYFIKLK